MNIKNSIKSIINNKRKFHIIASCISDTGKVRSNNEDNVYFDGCILPENHFSMEQMNKVYKSSHCEPLIIFDGMGGESAGELASFSAAQWIKDNLETLKLEEHALKETMKEINRYVYQAGKTKRCNQIGTTMSMLIFENGKVWVCNLGDSPIYRLRNEKIEMIGELHTNAEFLKQMGITNRKPGLMQFLGISEEELELDPFVSCIDVKRKDMFLICSDGLTDMVDENEIENILTEKMEVNEKTKKLIREALENGGRDNVTVILCEIK